MTCALCARMAAEPPLYADARWDVRHLEAPHGVPGWLLLLPRRHVASIAELDDAEAAALGVAIRHVHRTLLRVSGAARVYIAALAEAVPHVHVHLVPRAAGDDAPRGFPLFLRHADAADPAAVATISEAIRAALAAAPIPPGLPVGAPC